MDPAQLPRLEQIEASTRSRLTEARDRQWLGEVSALKENLHHIRAKKTQAQGKDSNPGELALSARSSSGS